MIAAVDLLQEDAHDGGVRLIADEELLLERAELAARQIAVDAGGGLTHLAVREQDARRIELGNLPGLGHDAAAVLGHLRRVAEARVELACLRIPAEAVGMP